MTDFIFYIIIALVFLAIGFIIGKLLTKNTSEKVTSELEVRNKLLLEEKQLNELNVNKLLQEKNSLNEEKHQIDIRLAQKVSEFQNLEEKLQENKAEVEKLQEKFSKEFEILASKILEEKSVKFTEQNKENLKNILSPLQEKIQT
ncbi:MAG: DNA recombination protein RmuC, partial [Lutibacter sp.]|nr:DNA recombination protein RmuC [Lutibacter sp.]